VTGFAIALLLEALFIIAILSLSMQSSGPEAGKRGLSAFTLEAESSAKAESSTETKAPVTQEPPRNINPVIPKPLLPPVNPVKAPPPSPDFIKVSKADFDAMDLSKIPANGGGAGAGDAKGAGQGSKGMMGPGAGPGGAQLYPVAWYREPYDSELAPYLAGVKRVPPGATAEIACRMIEHYHVENCQILGENPRGTGLAKALRLAAWQFLVRPPRIDNKPQLGVWVRIHFNFGRAEVAPEESAPE
jgi:protein TonB